MVEGASTVSLALETALSCGIASSVVARAKELQQLQRGDGLQQLIQGGASTTGAGAATSETDIAATHEGLLRSTAALIAPVPPPATSTSVPAAASVAGTAVLSSATLEQAERLCRDDPVRPEIPAEWRTSRHREMFFLGDEARPEAVICVAYCAEVPVTVEQLLSSEQGGIAIFYSVWSGSPRSTEATGGSGQYPKRQGAGREIIFAVYDELRRRGSCERYVTMSPKVQMRMLMLPLLPLPPVLTLLVLPPPLLLTRRDAELQERDGAAFSHAQRRCLRGS